MAGESPRVKRQPSLNDCALRVGGRSGKKTGRPAKKDEAGHYNQIYLR